MQNPHNRFILPYVGIIRTGFAGFAVSVHCVSAGHTQLPVVGGYYIANNSKSQ